MTHSFPTRRSSDLESSDGENKEALPAKALFLALWDHHYKNSMRIDLWTKDMPIDEMKRFFYETLQTLGDTFIRAAGEDPIRSEEHTSELQSLMRISYAVFCLKKKNQTKHKN